MSIVYQKNKATGKVYAYESSSYWVPELGQPRSKRKYLGVVDEVTGVITPTSGKRGRKPGTSSSQRTFSDDETEQMVNILKKRIEDLTAELRQAQKLNDHYRALLGRIHDISEI